MAGFRGSVNASVIAVKAGHMRCEVKVNGDKRPAHTTPFHMPRSIT